MDFRSGWVGRRLVGLLAILDTPKTPDELKWRVLPALAVVPAFTSETVTVRRGHLDGISINATRSGSSCCAAFAEVSDVGAFRSTHVHFAFAATIRRVILVPVPTREGKTDGGGKPRSAVTQLGIERF